MTPIDLGTLPADTPRAIRQALERLRAHAETLEATNQQLLDHVVSLRPAATFEEIRQALQAKGATPLNLTGLTGFPVTIGSDPQAPTISNAPPSIGPPPPPPPPPPDPGLPPFGPPQQGDRAIQCNGPCFIEAATGNIWPWRGASDFALYKQFLDGVDITAVISQRVATGVNIVRVWGMGPPPLDLDPANYSNTYYTLLPNFANYLAGFGVFLEFVVFAQTAIVMPSSVTQKNHLNDVVAAFAGVQTVFLELVNENDVAVNTITLANFARPNGILSSVGSNGADSLPPLPPWDYITFHASRGAEWPRQARDVEEIFEIDVFGQNTGVHRPCVNDEPIRAGESDIPDAQSTSVDDFYQFGALAAMMGAGATFHSDAGRFSDPWGPQQQACATAFFTAMQAVPLDAQTWQYTRVGLSDSPIAQDPALTLRTYARISEHHAVAIAVRPDPSWVAVAAGAWAIDSQTGPNGCLVFLSR